MVGISQKKLAVIHIIKKELQLSDDEYRDTLERVVGVRSAKDLNDSTFRKLMNYFVRSKHYRITDDGMTFRQKMFIQNLVSKLGWDESHLENFIHKYYHKEHLAQLTKVEASKMIESLKHIQAGRHVDHDVK